MLARVNLTASKRQTTNTEVGIQILQGHLRPYRKNFLFYRKHERTGLREARKLPSINIQTKVCQPAHMCLFPVVTVHTGSFIINDVRNLKPPYTRIKVTHRKI